MPTMITIQTEMPSDRPAMPTITTSTTNVNTMISNANDGSSDRIPTVQTTADTSTMNDVTSSSMHPMSTNHISTNPSMPDRPDTTMTNNQHTSSNPSIFSSSNNNGGSGGGGTTGTTGTMPTTNMYPSTSDSTKGPGIPPTMITTTMDRFPSTSTTYGNTNTMDLSTNEVKPPTYPSIYVSSNKPDDFSYPYPPNYHDKYNYYHEIYPIYTYPMVYETSNYPSSYMPSDGTGSSGNGGGGYAPNVPTMSYTPNTVDYYGTTPSMMTTYGGGSGTTYGGGNMGSTYGGSSNGGGGTTIPNTPTTYMGNGWSNADDIHRRKYGGRYPDYDNSGAYPEGKYNGSYDNGTGAPSTVPYIRTIFNPDDYNTNAKSEYMMNLRR